MNNMTVWVIVTLEDGSFFIHDSRLHVYEKEDDGRNALKNLEKYFGKNKLGLIPVEMDLSKII